MRFILPLLLSLFAFTASAQPLGGPTLAARAWLLLDQSTGQVLVANEPDTRIEPASLTKLMTAYVTFSALKAGTIALDQQVPVSEAAWRQIGSRMFIEPRKPVTVEELIRGMIVQSGNDACVALAELVASLFGQDVLQESEQLEVFDGKKWGAGHDGGIFGAPTLGQQLNDLREGEQSQLRELAQALQRIAAAQSPS